MAKLDYSRPSLRTQVLLTGLVLVLALATTSWGRRQIQLSTRRQGQVLTEIYFPNQISDDCARVEFFPRAAPGSVLTSKPVTFEVVALEPGSGTARPGPSLRRGSVQLSNHDPYPVDITLASRPRLGLQIRLANSKTFIQRSCQSDTALSSERKSSPGKVS